MKIMEQEVEIKLRYLPVLVKAVKIQRHIDEVVEKLQTDEKTLAEVRAMKAKLGKKSFQIDGCAISESKTASDKDFDFPFWIRILLKISSKISDVVKRYKKAHPEREIVLREGSPYVKVSVPKEVVERVKFAQVATVIKQFEMIQN